MSDMFPGVPIFPALGNHEAAPVNRYFKKYNVNFNNIMFIS